MQQSTNTTLRPAGGPTDHRMFFYRFEHELADTLLAFLEPSFVSNEPAAAVMTGAHLDVLEKRLIDGGLDPGALKAEGKLIVLNAEETLEEIYRAGGLDTKRFHELAGGLLDRTATGRLGGTTRVFGEMVDLLYKRGHLDAVVGLEELWNDLGQKKSFSLLCGYQADPLTEPLQHDFVLNVCQKHSRVNMVEREIREASLMQEALRNRLGLTEADLLWRATSSHFHRLPEPYSVRFWLRKNLPDLSNAISEHIQQAQQ